jgi:CRISP-associated protein Cas1
MKRDYYIFSNGEMKRDDNTFLFENEEDSRKNVIPCQDVNSFFFFGQIRVNTEYLSFLAKHGVCAHFFNYMGGYVGTYSPREKAISGTLLLKQVEHYQDEAKRLFLAKETIRAASKNIERNLVYYNSRGVSLSPQIEAIGALRKELDRSRSVQEVMGIEGNIRKTYYSAWNDIIPPEIDFTTRVKHPPDSLVNSLISFINTLVYSIVINEIHKTQLNSTISYLHELGTSRHSLALDVSEIFKPLIADRMVFTLLNRKQITDADSEKNPWILIPQAACQKKDCHNV